MRCVVCAFQVELASLHSAALAGLGEAMLETDPAGAAELATRALKVHSCPSPGKTVVSGFWVGVSGVGFRV